MIRFGATRWPAWSGATQSNSQWYNKRILSPSQYQSRAPWFAQQLSANTMQIDGNSQAVMDQDILYASNAGIKFFVWNWYGGTPPADATLQTEWNLYQTSANKNLVNWCLMIGVQPLINYANSDMTTLVNYFKQANYEKVNGTQPLVFVGSNAAFITGGDTAISAIRSASIAAGAGNPYFVVMNFDAPTAASAATSLGADAISHYARAFGGGGSNVTFASFSASVQSFWNTQLATGKPVVPCVTTGWNQQPIKSRGFPGYGGTNTDYGLNDCVIPATTAELVTLTNACKTWMAANAASCPANTAIFYAWDEHTEGGYIRPLWTATGPNKSRLDALAPVISS